MGLFSFFRKKKSQQEPLHTQEVAAQAVDVLDYSPLIEITKILTNGDGQAVEDMTLLAHDCLAFSEKYAAWCEEMLEGTCEKKDIAFVMAYWLTGYDTPEYTNPNKFGSYIDWKEETLEVVAGLKTPIKKLGYPLSLDDIAFTGEEFTDVALTTIDSHLGKRGYTLVSQDTDSDCYHLFIVPMAQFDRLVSLGKAVDIKFFNTFAP